MSVDPESTKLTRYDLNVILRMAANVAVAVFNQGTGESREERFVGILDAACVDLRLYDKLGEPLE